MTVPQTNTAALLAQSDRIAPEDLDLGARPRRTWISVTGRRRGPLLDLIVRTPLYWIIARLRSTKAHRSDPLEFLDRLVVMLAAQGFPECQLRLLEQHVGETITICYAGNAQRRPEQLDVDETVIEGTENEMQTRRLTLLAGGKTPTPEELENEAAQCRLEAGIQIEKARSLDREARRVRAGRPSRVLAMRVAERPEVS